MNQQEKISHVHSWFKLLKPRSLSRKVSDTLKFFMTGSPHLWFCMKYREIKFNKMLSAYGDLSIFVKNAYVRFIHMERSYIFGRKLTGEQNNTIQELQEKNVPDNDIRILVVNRLLDKRGTTIYSNKKEIFTLVLGIIFLFLSGITFLLMTALVWFSPLTIFYKIAFQIGITLIILYSSYVLSYFSIFPYNIMSRYK